MKSDRRLRRALYIATPPAILGYYFFFTWRSLRIFFDPDDMMNLYMAWSKPWSALLAANVFFRSDVYRPLGGLFYRAMYEAWGFDPLPFRVACLAIGIANIALCYWFVRLVSGSERTAALAILVFAFHTRLMEVWYRNAVIYDLLCFTFFYLAADLYIAARKRGGFPGWARSCAIVLCYVCALDAKEVAVALPVVLLGYELLFERFIWRNLRLIAITAAMNLPYIAGKTNGPNALTKIADYRPEYSWARFSGAWSVFESFLFVRGDRIAPWQAVGILAGLLTIGAAWRSRGLVFAWIVLFTATLPMAFLPYRGGFVLYVSYVGWTMYAAVAVVAIQDSLLNYFRMSGRAEYRTALACVVFLLAAWRAGKINLHDQRADPERHWLHDGPRLVRSMAAQLSELHPDLPAGARLLFLEDAFSTDEWTPYFIVKLLYYDDRMVVDRLKMMREKTPDWKDYQYVFTYEGGVYRQLKP